MKELQPENVQSYPRPPALEPVMQEVRVVFAGVTIAKTRDALRVLETHHAPTYYIPPSDITARLIPARGSSFCEWKGDAAYFDVKEGGQVARRAAWAYPAPTPRFTALAGFVAIYATAMEACFVGDEQVIAQPGDFYGGWVTANLTGRIKGAAGTEFW